ncbi:MAG: hypothetical protein JO274_10725, partial [Gammaproteobacteria bacterium]|nr:hypothetical protein [Gammaproteobacteria bacterium]
MRGSSVLGAVLVASAAASALMAAGPAPPAPGSAAAAELIEHLGLHVAAQPVRERPGWRPPRVVLISKEMLPLRSGLQQAAPSAQLIEFSAATGKQVATADAAIGVCSAEMLAQAKQLQWIQVPGAGVDRCVQQPLLHERHLLLTNLQGTMGPSMAEHVLGMMLALSRHFEYYFKQQQQAHWVSAPDAPELADLDGKTVLVVGLGGIGAEVARRAHALGMRVVATRASGRTGPDFVSYVGLPDELLKLARDADFIVNCTPLTPQTTGIFNREFLDTLKPCAYFISVGRGKSTVTAD